MNRAEAAKLRAAKLKAKDPEYFAKLAARGKGKSAPKRARAVTKEVAQKGGLRRGKGVAYQARVNRSQELERLLAEEQEAKLQQAEARRKRAATKKQEKKNKRILEEWNEDETTVDNWE